MISKALSIRPLTSKDYAEIYCLWNGVPGIGLSDADAEQAVARFLERNPRLSFVCCCDQKIVGTILGGHDGRRGFIYHACVSPAYRGRGIGRMLAEKVLEELKNQEIKKCHLFVLCENEIGGLFWERLCWERRTDIIPYSKSIALR